MVCIYCGTKTAVTNSRSSRKKASTWRRRECSACRTIFTTREVVDLSGSIRVKTVSKGLQPFLRDRLFLSVHRSVSHRKNALEDAGNLTDTIISQLLNHTTSPIIETPLVISAVASCLRRFDKSAETHYLAHHSEPK